MMILNLIIASYNQPFYKDLMEQWKRYMNISSLIKSYFIINDICQFVNDEKNMEYKIVGEYLYFNCLEIPIPGIFEKTAKAMSVFKNDYPEVWKEVHYVIRTNVSSFYIWDRLLMYVKNIPKSRFVGGDINETPLPRYISGCGILMSKDVCDYLIHDLSNPLCISLRNNHNRIPLHKYLDDDRMIGIIFHQQHINFVSITRFNMPDNYEKIPSHFDELVLSQIPNNVFHIRTRCGTDDFRLIHGSKIYERLVDEYYPETIFISSEIS